MIIIKNRVRTIVVDVKKLKADIQVLLDSLGYGDFDLGVLLTTNKTIRTYNKKYRNIDKPTDVLSFPFYPHLKRGQRIVPKTVAEKNLGDIIISLEVVQNEAQRLKIPFDVYLKRVLVHGLCHLLGYTHDTDKDFKHMEKKEHELLALVT